MAECQAVAEECGDYDFIDDYKSYRELIEESAAAKCVNPDDMERHKDCSSHIYMNWRHSLSRAKVQLKKENEVYDDCDDYVESASWETEDDENIYMDIDDIVLQSAKCEKKIVKGIYDDSNIYEDSSLFSKIERFAEEDNIYMTIPEDRPLYPLYQRSDLGETDLDEYEDNSNNYMNTVPVYIRTYDFPSRESINESIYNRRQGAAEMTGELFEVGIAMFLLLKGIFETESFELATNVEWAGAFDDLIFKFKDKQKRTEHTCLFQLKHKSKKLLRRRKLQSDTGDFSLLKFYDSYCQIKKEFSQHSDDNILFSESFDNCNFIIYTNTAFHSRDLLDLDVSEKDSQNLLNSGGIHAQIFSIHSDSVVFSRLEAYRSRLEDIANNDLSYEESVLKLKHFQKLDHCKRLFSLKKNEFRKVLDEQLSEELVIEMWEKFLGQLQLYTKQASEKGLDNLIKQIIKLYCKTSDKVTEELFSKLREAMIQWWRKGKCSLNENSSIFWHLVMDVYVSSILLSMSIKLSGISRLKFIDTEDITSKITHIVTKGCTKFACLRILQKLGNKGYIMVDSCTMLYRQTEILAVWEYGAWCSILIIEGDKCDVESITKISCVLHSSPDKKFVIIGSINNQIAKKLCQQFQINNIEDNFCFGQLDHESKKIVLESELIFQGNPITLKSLASEDIIQDNLTADHIVKLFSNNQKLEVGQVLDTVDNCYIERILVRKEHVDENIFLEYEDAKLAITGMTKEEFQHIVPSDQIDAIADGVSFREDRSFCYFIINNADDFKSLCEIHDNIHWIEKTGNHFIWRCSKGDVSLIKNHLKEEIVTYDDDLDIMRVCGRMILIIAEPGMGKSTEICRLSHKLKQLYPAMWTVIVNLNDHTDYLSQNKLCPEELLLRAGGFSTQFERKLFMFQVLNGGNIVVMFDGFDEVCPNYYDKTVDILRYLSSKTKIRNIWVTSRPVMGEKLQQQFSTLSFYFQHFTENDQKTFLMKFWKIPEECHYDLDDFISKLLKLPERFLGDKLKEFTGIPLQTKMLAEVFQMEALVYSETGENKLPQKLNLLELYRRFIDKKWEVYCEKLNIDMTKVEFAENYEEKKYVAEQCHMICAVMALLEHDKIKQLKNIKTLVKEYEIFIDKFRAGHNKTGIIIDIVNRKPVFIHRTFAEYFLAILFTENIVCDFNKSKNKFYRSIRKLVGVIELNNFYKKEIFFNFEIVRSFFDMILALKCRLHVAVLNQDKILVETLLLTNEDVNERDAGGRTPLHLAVTSFLNVLEDDESRTNAEQILLLLLNHGADINIKDQVMCWRPLRLAVEIKAWSCVVILLEINVKSKDMIRLKQNVNDNKYMNSVLAEAGKRGSVKLAYFILKCGVGTERNIAMGNSDVTLLHYAAKYGKLSLVKFLVENKAKLDTRDSRLRRTPIMLAAEQGHVEVTEFLLQKGAGVNECDIDGNTAGLIAARSGQNEILELLTHHGANMIICNRYENTALHQAAGCGSVNCVSLLLKILPDTAVNYMNKMHNTPLMTAARHGQCSVIEVLIKHGADLKVCDKEGNSVLHYAAEGGSIHCVKLLLDSGLQIDLTNCRNESTVWCAAHLGKFHVIKLLCEYGADLNVQDNVLMDTPLHAAVRGGYINIVKCLLEFKASFISCNKWRTTPLHLAARLCHVDIAQYLVEYGANLNISIRVGGTPLHVAARWGCLEIVKCLIQHGASLTTFDYEGNTPLHIAVKRGHLEVVKYLSKSGASLTICDHEGHTPIQAAAASGQLHIIEYLLNHGASLMDCDNQGYTSLHMATAWGHSHIVEFLIKHDAVMEKYDYDGYSPLHVAVKWGHLNVLAWLINHGINIDVCDMFGKTPLHVAAIWGHLDIVEWLVYHGASLTVNDKEGHTPLHLAIKEGQLQVLQYLLQHHESVRPCEEDGHTPLHVATRYGQLNIVEWLVLEGGANLRDFDGDGKMPIHLAASDGHLHILKFILQQGVDLSECDVEGHEPLHLAARSGHLQIVEHLIELGGNLTASNKLGNSPLHLAINWCHFPIIKYLMEHGASLAITDKRGDTPLHIAARWGNVEIINFLMQYEPSLMAKNNEGYTPLHVSIRWGHLPVLNLFKECKFSFTICDNMGNSPLLIAATWGHLHIVRWLLQNEAALTVDEKSYNLLLHIGAKWGHLEIIELCLKYGTSLEVRDDKGCTPLHTTVKCGHLKVAQILVLHGASLTTFDDEGQMPVHVGVRWAQLHVVEWLVQFEPGLSSLTENGFTLLHIAARWGHLQITEWLLKQGARLTVRDKQGNTPLHIATTWGRINIVKCFVQNNANLTAYDNNGHTPLHIAVKVGDIKVVMCLIHNGDDFMVLDKEGHTPLHIAAREGNLDIVKYLVSCGANVAISNRKNCTPLQLASESVNDPEISEFQRNKILSVVKFLSDDCSVNSEQVYSFLPDSPLDL